MFFLTRTRTELKRIDFHEHFAGGGTLIVRYSFSPLASCVKLEVQVENPSSDRSLRWYMEKDRGFDCKHQTIFLAGTIVGAHGAAPGCRVTRPDALGVTSTLYSASIYSHT